MDIGFELREVLHRDFAPHAFSWRHEAVRKLRAVARAEDLLGALGDPDPNVRIVAAVAIGRLGPSLPEPMRSVAVAALLRALEDPAQNRIENDGFQGDEEESYYVSATAAEALGRLGFAPDPRGVFEEARRRGVRARDAENVG